jgi:penicillin-binding protein 2
MSRASARPPPGAETREREHHRLWVFYPLLAALLLTLAGGLAWQQLLRADLHSGRERAQGQRRVLVPGPRGRILDREGRVLAGNRPRFAVTLALDALGSEFRTEFAAVRKNYRAPRESPPPNSAQLEQIARTAVVRRYLDRLEAVLGRRADFSAERLQRHFSQQLLLPYLLMEDLTPAEYARLVEQLPADSPLQVFSAGVRDYPYGPLAAHVLGYVGDTDTAPADELPGDDLTTFRLRSSVGRAGLENFFDEQLQGETGFSIFRVTPAGYRLNPPLERRPPARGGDLVTSLDAVLQAAAETPLNEYARQGLAGAAVALDVRTGEVLVLASAPGYNLSDFSPRASQATIDDLNARKAWENRAIRGAYPPGSTFKLLTTIAALRHGALEPDAPLGEPCEGSVMIGGKSFKCYNGKGHHGAVHLAEAIAKSCDVFFYQVGTKTGVDNLAAEARRFHLDRPAGIELNETRQMLIPDRAWKKRTQLEDWFPGDTANMAIGQGYVLETPLIMACFAASLARDEVWTQPTLVHRPNAPAQRHERTGLTPAQRAALLAGMEGCTTDGTASGILSNPALANYIPGLRIAGKTGTAQIPGNKNAAWFICFAPLENPQIAIAVMLEGDTAGEEVGGGRYAAPVAQAILKAWAKTQPAAAEPAAPAASGLPALTVPAR